MRRTIAGFVAAGLVSLLGVPPVGAHGALSETYDVFAPSAMPVHSSLRGCTIGTEDVHKDSHAFKVARAGVIQVQLSNYTGDWDLGIVDDETQAILAYPAKTAFIRVETVAVALRANQAITIVACNFSGGPTATVDYTFFPDESLRVAVGDVSVAEGGKGTRAAVFTVSLSEPWESGVTVAYTTNDGTATSPSDYAARSGTLTFAPGVTSAAVKVPITGDGAAEGDERFTLDLSQPTGGAVITDARGTADIVDDDSDTTRRLAVGDVAVAEGDVGTTTPAVFTVSLSRPSTTTVSVAYATSRDTAAKGDFTPRSGTLSFAPGVTSATVKVPVMGDDAVEEDETFTVVLSSPAGAVMADATGLGTILDDI